LSYLKSPVFFVLLFLVGAAYVLLFKRDFFYVFNVIPFVLFIIYLWLYQWENLMLFLSFITPLSVGLKEFNLTENIDLSLPSEPIMAGFLLMFLLHIIFTKEQHGSFFHFIRHPVTLLIIIQTIWIFITALSSVDIVVSLKFFIARLWFLGSCYFMTFYFFRNKEKIIPFLSAYILSLMIVCIYTIYQHAGFGFDHKSADWIMSPFYNDHTAYGAALGIFIPVVISWIGMKYFSVWIRFLLFMLSLFFITAIILSYARAAWLSLIMSLLVLITWVLRIRFITLIVGISSLLAVVFIFQEQILYLAGKNTTDAEKGLVNNVVSITNISSDVSNLERLNRWSCALRMWMDKPVFGWGPGTYMFNYASYQLSKEKTIISTNFGTNGNAHSEYLGPLAEQGLPGFLIMFFLLIMVTYYGYKIYYKEKNKQDKIFFAGIFLGLFSYYMHGFINNFLDTDKLSLPFWALMCLVVIFDIKQKKQWDHEKIF